MVCSPVKVQLLFKQAESCPSLRLIVKMGDVTKEEREQAEKIGLTLVAMEEVEVSSPMTLVAFVSFIPLTVCLSLQARGRENPADLVVS